MPNDYLNKTAEGVAPPVTWGEVDARLRQTALDNVVPQLGQVGMGMAGIGASIAGLRHLLRLRTEQQVRDKELKSQPGQVHIYARKHAGINDFVSEVASGAHARSPVHFPWFMPAAAATGVAAGVGGFKMTDHLLSRIRARAKQKELDNARAEYEQALSSYSGKTAGERSKLAKDIDRIIDAVTSNTHKRAEAQPGDYHRMMGMLAGLYLTAMGGAVGYGINRGMKSQRASSGTRAAERAQLERQLQQQRQISPLITAGTTV